MPVTLTFDQPNTIIQALNPEDKVLIITTSAETRAHIYDQVKTHKNHIIVTIHQLSNQSDSQHKTIKNNKYRIKDFDQVVITDSERIAKINTRSSNAGYMIKMITHMIPTIVSVPVKYKNNQIPMAYIKYLYLDGQYPTLQIMFDDLSIVTQLPYNVPIFDYMAYKKGKYPKIETKLNALFKEHTAALSEPSRVLFLKNKLIENNFQQSLKALAFIQENMSAKNNMVRKGSGEDYYIHCVDVALFLYNTTHPISEDIITVALLHDAVEDIPNMTVEKIAQQYSADVADAVERLTKTKSINYHTNEIEMRDYLNQIEENEVAALVKTSDRVHNFSTLAQMSNEHRTKQLRNTLDYYIPFLKRCRKQYPAYAHVFEQAKTIIQPIANELLISNQLIEKQKLFIEQITELTQKMKSE